MKNLFLTLLSFVAIFHASAATHITTPAVSGHWTLAGSPYIIHNNVTVNSTAALTIDPGVEVAFAGYFKMNVEGIITAAGTAAQPIVFRSYDTTGWHTSETAGGWYGMDIGHYWGTSTLTSTITHCRFQDMRGYGLGVFFRSTDIRNSEFTHNTGRIMQSAFADTTYTLGLYDCRIHDNKTSGNMLLLHFGGLVIHKCHIYNNISGGSTLASQGCKVRMDSCEIHDNLQTAHSLETTVNFRQMTGTIRANKIHHNTSQYAGALAVTIGKTEISGNYICNNRTIVGFTGSSACGSLEGGGGVRISGEGGAEPSYFLVRNNVIANNYAAYAGGAIYVMFTDATIANNTIVNNKSPWGGAMYLFNEATMHPHTRVNVKNNLFKHNVSADFMFGLPDTLIAVWIGAADTLLFERNVSENHFADNYILATTFPFVPVGDTGSNFATTNPGMIAPTLTASYLEDATGSNFDLLITSPAINRGEITLAMPDAIDHAGESRIQGAAIDVGAFEFGNLCSDMPTAPSAICVGASASLGMISGGTWTSHDAPGTVTVSSTGLVTGVRWGFAVINCIAGGCLTSVVMRIDTMVAAGTLTGSTAACSGMPFIVSASVAGGTWSCTGASSVAGGTITGLPAGTAVISYTVGNFCGTDVATLPVTINVAPAEIEGDTSACAMEMGAGLVTCATPGGVWSCSDATIATIDAGTGVITGHTEGTATVTYTLPTGCYSTATITVGWCPDAVTEVIRNSRLKVYPNPVAEQLVVECNTGSAQRIKIYDLQGKCVYESMLNGKQALIDVRAYKAGIYLVQVGDEQAVQVVRR